MPTVSNVVLVRDYIKKLLDETNELIIQMGKDGNCDSQDFWEYMGYAKACDHIYQNTYNIAESCNRQITIDRFPKNQFSIQVTISKQFKVRVWLGVRLLWLACLIMGCELELDFEENDE